MRKKQILTLLSVIAALAAVAMVVSAGNPDNPPGPPETTSSYSLEDIYDRLATGAAGTQITFTEPISGPAVSTMHTLNDLMSVAPFLDNTNGATAADVLTDQTFWSLTGGQWGGTTGTMPNIGAVTLTPTTTQQMIAMGYHNGSGYIEGDADLVAANIVSGTAIFGVDGSALEASGNATDSDVLSSVTYSNDAGASTGTMPNIGAVTLTPTTTQQTIAAGYHNGGGYVEGDADLLSGNIHSGVNLFGIAGDSNVVNTSSGNAVAGEILRGRGAWVDGVEVTGSMYPAPVPKTGAGGLSGYTEVVGEDGHADMRMGVDWITSTRFITGTTGTTGVTVVVTDTLTGLVWLQDANCIANEYPGFDNDASSGDGQVTWQHALDFVAGITVTGSYSNCAAGFNDWRLPNVRELQSLIDYGEYRPALPDGHPFISVKTTNYWSSTSHVETTDDAWFVYLDLGYVYHASKSFGYDVWPVRGGQ